MTTRRTLAALAATLLALTGARGQEPRPAPPRDLPHWMQYKRFTRDGEVLKDDAQGRLDWWRERMGGDLSPEFSRRLIREAEVERAKYPHLFPGPELAGVVAPAAASWVNLGPTGSDFTQNGIQMTKVDSGRIRAILPHPTDANTVWVLTTGGGLWKTINFLAATPTWTPLTDFVGSTTGGGACFGRDASTIYVGVGEAAELGVGGFVVRSTDGGTTWGGAAFMGTATRVYDIKVDTTVGSTSDTDIVLCATNAGVYRSTNGGASFSAISTFTGFRGCSLARTSAGWLVAVASTTSPGAGALYLSPDKGATWSPIANGGTVISNIGRATLAVGQPGDATVYCFAANTGDTAQRDLFRSGDGGQNWNAVGLAGKTPTNPNGDQSGMDIMAGQAFFNQMVLVDPTDATRNTVYIGGQLSAAKSTNGGGTWTLVSNWLPGGSSGTAALPYVHADHHSAAFSTVGGNRIFFGTDGGLFTSVDGGTTWDDTKNRGIVSHLIYSLAASPTVSGSALVGLQDNGTRIRVTSPTPTSTFNQIRGGDGFGVGWSQASQASTLSSYVYNSIRRSTVNPPADQSAWVSFVTGLPTPLGTSTGASSSYYFVTPIITPTAAADPTGTVFFTYGNSSTGPGAQRIYKSGASGWTTIATSGTAGILTGHAVRAVSHGIGVHPTDLNRIAAAGTGGYVWLTTDGGTSWTQAYLGSTGTDGQNIGWVGFNSNVAWASSTILYACSEAQAAGSGRVARTANGGTTWTRADTGLPDVPVTKLVVDPTDAKGATVYAATWLGVYRTTNGGGSWSVLGTGLPQVRTSDLYLAPDGSYLRASTYGRGVWEISLGTPAPTGPTITTQPASVSKVAGEQATFTVAATGTGTLGYQWQKGGVNIAGATSASYTTPPTVAADNGAQFRAVVTDSVGPTTSNAATLTVTGCPGGGGTSQLLVNPGFESGATTWVQSNSTIISSDTSVPARTGSWYAYLGDYTTATTDSLYQTVTIPADATAANLTWWMTIGNSPDTPATATNTLTLRVRSAAGATLNDITTWSNLNANWPNYDSRGPYSLLPYRGQTVQIYLTSTQPGGLGTGTAWLLDDFTLNITTPGTGSTAATVTTNPSSQSVAAGGSVTFTVAGTGTAPLSYQWRKGGTVIPGANAASLTLNPVNPSDAGSYDAQVFNCAGFATSSAATLTVGGGGSVSVTVSPKPVTLVTGGAASFAALVTGSSNTAVTWSILSGGGALSNVTATTATYTAPATAGTAVVRAASQADGTASDSATITIRSRDVNGDGVVDILDLAAFARAWLATPSASHWNILCDLNGDGVIDDADLILFLAGF